MEPAKIILDLCGGTGAWSQPYRDAGYDVRLVTLPDHDVRTYVPPANVHGILAAPPCTEFAVSGARWWAEKDPALLEEALEIVDACLRIIDQSRPAWWALENPVGRLRTLRGRELMVAQTCHGILGDHRATPKPTLTFDPCDYGDPWTKNTLVWGRFCIPKQNPVPATEFWGWRKLGGKSERTKRLRSITPPGFAKAFFEANP